MNCIHWSCTMQQPYMSQPSSSCLVERILGPPLPPCQRTVGGGGGGPSPLFCQVGVTGGQAAAGGLPSHKNQALRNRDAAGENGRVSGWGGGGEGRTNWEIMIDMCILPRVKQMASGNLLYSMGIQPSHPLSSPSPLAPNPSQHQSLFQ